MVKVGNGKARFSDAFVLEESCMMWSWCWSDATTLTATRSWWWWWFVWSSHLSGMLQLTAVPSLPRVEWRSVGHQHQQR